MAMAGAWGYICESVEEMQVLSIKIAIVIRGTVCAEKKKQTQGVTGSHDEKRPGMGISVLYLGGVAV